MSFIIIIIIYFVNFYANSLNGNRAAGYDMPASHLPTYYISALSASPCQYWCHRTWESLDHRTTMPRISRFTTARVLWHFVLLSLPIFQCSDAYTEQVISVVISLKRRFPASDYCSNCNFRYRYTFFIWMRFFFVNCWIWSLLRKWYKSRHHFNERKMQSTFFPLACYDSQFVCND